MPTSPGGIPYPSLSSVPNVPSDMQAMTVALDQLVIPKFNTQAGRNTSYPSPVNGQFVYMLAAPATSGMLSPGLTYYNGTKWLNVHPVAFRKASNTSRTNNTLTTDTDLTTAGLEANSVYTFRYDLRVTGNTTADFAFDIAGPTSCTGYWHLLLMDNLAAATAPPTYAKTFTSTPSTSTGLNIAGTPTWIIIEGQIFTGASTGSITLRWAQANTNAVATVVETGSLLQIQKIA